MQSQYAQIVQYSAYTIFHPFYHKQYRPWVQALEALAYSPVKNMLNFGSIILKSSVIYLVYLCCLKVKGHRFESLKSFLNVLHAFFLSNLLINRSKFCCLLPAFNFIGPALTIKHMLQVYLYIFHPRSLNIQRHNTETRHFSPI